MARPVVLHSKKGASCATDLLISCSIVLREDHIRICSHGLRQLVDGKSIASCQQTCCKLIVKTSYAQAYCKLFQRVVTSLQMTSLLKLTSLLPLVDNLQSCKAANNYYKSWFLIVFKSAFHSFLSMQTEINFVPCVSQIAL